MRIRLQIMIVYLACLLQSGPKQGLQLIDYFTTIEQHQGLKGMVFRACYISAVHSTIIHDLLISSAFHGGARMLVQMTADAVDVIEPPLDLLT